MANQIEVEKFHKHSFIYELSSDMLLSLKHLACVRIANGLWNSQNVLVVVEDKKKFRGRLWCLRDQVVGLIERFLMEKISQLNLDTSLKDDIAMFLDIVGFQIVAWKFKYVAQKLLPEEIANRYLTRLSWTLYGTVDEKKTAQRLVLDDEVPVLVRYRLAYYCCLMEEIQSLSELVRSEQKPLAKPKFLAKGGPAIYRFRFFCMNEDISDFNDYCVFNNYLIPTDETFDGNILQYSIQQVNEVAFKYFWNRLDESKRRSLLFGSAQEVISAAPNRVGDIYSTNILCFLFSHMNEDVLQVFLEKHPHTVLIFFLHWPWDKKFSTVFQHAKNYIHNKYDFQFLHQKIVKSSSVYKNDILQTFLDYLRKERKEVYDEICHSNSLLL